jgi:hypothetical protein
VRGAAVAGARVRGYIVAKRTSPVAGVSRVSQHVCNRRKRTELYLSKLNMLFLVKVTELPKLNSVCASAWRRAHFWRVSPLARPVRNGVRAVCRGRAAVRDAARVSGCCDVAARAW